MLGECKESLVSSLINELENLNQVKGSIQHIRFIE